MNSKVLSIAGFDGSGGAGIQADLKTFSAFSCYGMTVLTALPIQNTLGVKTCYELPLQAIEDQLYAIFTDIVPDTIKIGMLFNASIIELVANFLKQQAKGIPIVLDPVMYAKSGDALLLPQALESLRTQLIPLATLITPNLPEATALTGLSVNQPEEMEIVMQQLLVLGPKAVLLKGGHLQGNQSVDLYEDQQGTKQWLDAPRIMTRNTHGTGCTLSAAIAACLSRKMSLLESCKMAKRYLTCALQAAKLQQIGRGNGPLNHSYYQENAFPV